MAESRLCEECGRPVADYGEFLKIHGAFRPPPFPPEGTCGRDNQAQDYYDNGQCEDCATYPLKKRIAELEARLALAEAVIEAAKRMRDEHVERVAYCTEFDAALQAFDRAANAEPSGQRAKG